MFEIDLDHGHLQNALDHSMQVLHVSQSGSVQHLLKKDNEFELIEFLVVQSNIFLKQMNAEE